MQRSILLTLALASSLAAQEQITHFKNSFAVCLEAKDYLVRF